MTRKYTTVLRIRVDLIDDTYVATYDYGDDFGYLCDEIGYGKTAEDAVKRLLEQHGTYDSALYKEVQHDSIRN